MDVLFINSTDELTLSKEINGTMLLGTKLLQDGFDVDILRFAQIKSFGKEYAVFVEDMTSAIIQRDPKCVSFYSLWPDYHIMLRIARKLKQIRPGIVIIFGGPQASCTAPATLEAMDFIDYINTGEGENTIVPLMRGILRGEGDLNAIPGLHYRKDGQLFHNYEQVPLCDLNALPRWDERLLLPQTDNKLDGRTYFMPIDVGRGCPYSCTFCCTSYFWRRVYRLKTPEKIVEEIKYYQEKFGINSFWFSHDAFTVQKKLVEQVCDKILEENLNIVWRCSARLDCVSEDLILKMKKAGMIQMELGVETGSPRMQKLINKNLDLKKARSIVSFLLKEKLRVGLFFMYGFPQETEEDLNQTVELSCSFLEEGVPYTSMSHCKFCPSTGMTEEYFDQLVFDPDCQMNFRDIYGCKEEEEIIKANKAIFPFYFHLNTDVRNAYEYMFFFMAMYRDDPDKLCYLRQAYKGDNLKFYRDFREANRQWFDAGVEVLEKKIKKDVLGMLLNLTAVLDVPKIRQIEAVLKLTYRAKQVAMSESNMEIRDTYNMNYVDFKLKRPIEQYSEGKTEILLRKANGKFEMQILNIQWG